MNDLGPIKYTIAFLIFSVPLSTCLFVFAFVYMFLLYYRISFLFGIVCIKIISTTYFTVRYQFKEVRRKKVEHRDREKVSSFQISIHCIAVRDVGDIYLLRDINI